MNRNDAVIRADLVVLDLDGTLIDHTAAAETALRASFSDWFPALPLDHDRLLAAWVRGLERYMPRYLSGEKSFAWQRRMRLRDLAAEFGISELGADERVDEMFDEYSRRYARAWTAFPDAVPTIEKLRAGGLRLAVLTNGERTQQSAKLAVLQLPHPIPLYVPHDLGAPKPEPRSFQAVCTDLGVPPSRAVYVGDELEKDAVGASRAGLTGVWLDRDGAGVPAGAPAPQYRIEGLDELAPLLGVSAH